MSNKMSKGGSGASMVKGMLLCAAASGALFAGFAVAPTFFADRAEAQKIVVAPPSGAPMSFADLVSRVSPAVVSIQVRYRPTTSRAGEQADLPPFLEEFLRRNPEYRPPRREGGGSLGSGFIIAQDGVIVTNHHVIDEASEITVILTDKSEYKAELIGSDQLTDLAVLRIKAPRPLPYVAFDRGASNNVRVGDWVVAVGNPFGLDGTATAGIISAKGRREGASSYVDFLQIDAPINRGNSGGPTFDLQGRVIGVNSAIFSPTGGSVGIGFAIPADTAAQVVDQLSRSGRIVRGWLGVQVQAIDKDMARSLGLNEPKGAMVASVVAGSPASKGGVLEGDVILTIDGAAVEDQRDLTRKVGAIPVGRVARFEVLRDGARRTLPVTLAERPTEERLASADNPNGAPQSGEGGAGEVRQAALGLEVRVLTDADRQRLSLERTVSGLIVTDVDPDTDLSRKGVRAGDVLVAAGSAMLRSPADLTTAVANAQRAGRPLMLQIEGRGGRRFVAADLSAGGAPR